MRAQNLMFVALPVPEITGGTQNIWAIPDTPITFLQNFSWAIIRMDPVALPVPEIIVIAVLGKRRP